eukprot:TRINITY_DN8539_c0_g1_i1.p1 TRINITY_DN8539_c0_g1~~TRINITY_DN8539_c0_g1_i1.p1  ORF type:complete len:137 (-),score=18.90 TRINITY_DN8539_c0_g1_i1:13-423(-)
MSNDNDITLRNAIKKTREYIDSLDFDGAIHKIRGAKKSVDQGITTTAHTITRTFSVERWDNTKASVKKVVKEVPSTFVVIGCTVAPLVIFRKSIFRAGLATAAGFGLGVYYCYPDLVSNTARKILATYKEKSGQKS